MWPLILIALVVFLILIVLSVCAYPFICAVIAIACKKYNVVVTTVLLILTIALYIFACTTLEYEFDSWCYSVYAGIVLTPIVLYVCTGVVEPRKWPENGETPFHSKPIIPILIFFTSLLFTVEGWLRMAHTNSIYLFIKNGMNVPESDNYLYYSDEFQYAGTLLFFVSVVMTLYVGISFVVNRKKYKRILEEEAIKKAKIDRSVEEVTLQLTKECECFTDSLCDSEQVNDVLLSYNEFCKTFVAVIQCSDEKVRMSILYESFKGIEPGAKPLLFVTGKCFYYVYPMGLVIKGKNDIYRYIPFGRDSISISTEQKTMERVLSDDIQPIRQYWLNTCRDGSPDLRYKYNPKKYVYEYGVICLDNLKINVWRVDTTTPLLSAYQKMYSNLCDLRTAWNRSRKEIQSKPKVIENAIDKSFSTTKPVIEVKDDIKKNHTEVVVPQTIEECFLDIIRKRGDDVLKDKSLIRIIATLYKDVDISEYIETMEKMASEDFYFQFTALNKQNDFALYNVSSTFARKNKLNAQKCLYVVNALVSAIKQNNKNKKS